MEEYSARPQSPHSYPVSHNLARQPYELPGEDEPLEDEGNVVQLPAKSRGGQVPPASFEAIAAESVTPRSPAKRKQSSNKGRSATSKPKTTKAYPPSRTAKAQPFADELQHLEELAERINRVLEERAHQKAYLEQAQAMQAQAWQGMPDLDPRFAPPAPRSPQPPQAAPPVYGHPALEEVDTESLKQQARRIRHRLSQLEVQMNEMEAEDDEPADFSTAYQQGNYQQGNHQQGSYQQGSYQQGSYQQGNHQQGNRDAVYRDRPPYQSPPAPQPHYSEPPSHYSEPQAHYAPPQSRANPFDPVQQRAEYEHWRAAEELRRFQQQEQWTYPETPYRDRPAEAGNFTPSVRQLLAQLRRLPTGTFLEVPRRPMDWVNDAAMWLVLAAIVRIATRYLVVPFPFLAPIFTLMMFAPTAIAIFLVAFRPQVGWLPVYRLFLITIGFIIGGKLF